MVRKVATALLSDVYWWDIHNMILTILEKWPKKQQASFYMIIHFLNLLYIDFLEKVLKKSKLPDTRMSPK